jgi:hypothetical protein
VTVARNSFCKGCSIHRERPPTPDRRHHDFVHVRYHDIATMDPVRPTVHPHCQACTEGRYCGTAPCSRYRAGRGHASGSGCLARDYCTVSIYRYQPQGPRAGIAPVKSHKSRLIWRLQSQALTYRSQTRGRPDFSGPPASHTNVPGSPAPAHAVAQSDSMRIAYATDVWRIQVLSSLPGPVLNRVRNEKLRCAATECANHPRCAKATVWAPSL